MPKRRAEGLPSSGPSKRRKVDATSRNGSVITRPGVNEEHNRFVEQDSACSGDAEDLEESGTTEDARPVPNARLQKLLSVGSLKADLSTVSLNIQQDLAAHLFYAESLRRGLLGSHTSRGQSLATSLSSWTRCPLKTDELPALWSEWTLADDVMALISHMCSARGANRWSHQAEEAVGGSIVLHSHGLVDGVLHELARQAASVTADGSRKPATGVWSGGISQHITWRSVLDAAIRLNGIDSAIVDKAHARLSALYRPKALKKHRLQPLPIHKDPRKSLHATLLDQGTPARLRTADPQEDK